MQSKPLRQGRLHHERRPVALKPGDVVHLVGCVQIGGRAGQPQRPRADSDFDVLSLLIATDAEIDRLGHDRRRLRPNLVICGTRAAQERDWPGRALQIGDAVIGVHSLRPRCIVTTIDPDTGEQDLDVLRDIHRRFDGMLALNCWVISPAVVHVGDEVRELDDAPAPPARAGGWVTGAPYELVP